MSKRCGVKIDTPDYAQDLWTSSYIQDQLLIDLCEKEQTLSTDITNELSREIFDPGRSISVLKYPAEFLRTAYRISVSDYAYFPAFRIDPRDLSPHVLKEILAVDKETQDLIILKVIERILRSNNKLLYLEHIQPNRKHLSWEWEEFNFGAGDGKNLLDSRNTKDPVVAA